MKGWLLDTNVISEARRPIPARAVLAFVAAQPLDTIFVSVVTLAEIRYGIELMDDVEKRAAYTVWLDRIVRPMFDRRVLHVTEAIMLRWRLMVHRGRLENHTFPQPDLIIAATAAEHGLTVVTRNTRDFRRAGVPVLDPWRFEDR